MNKSFYDRFFSAGHHKPWRDAPGKVVILGYLLQNVRADDRLIDIGCGDGYFLDRISVEVKAGGKALKALGVDISDEAISLAAAEYPQHVFRAMNAEQLLLDTGTFDWVVSYGVLEHVPSPVSAIGELSRILRSGGQFALMMPTVGHYRQDRQDEGWYEDLNVPPQLQWNFRRETWERLFAEAGLKLEEMELSREFGANFPGNFYFGQK